MYRNVLSLDDFLGTLFYTLTAQITLHGWGFGSRLGLLAPYFLKTCLFLYPINPCTSIETEKTPFFLEASFYLSGIVLPSGKF